MSLLVLESDLEVAPSIADRLNAIGYESFSAPDVKSALRMCEHTQPELIVCDRLEWAEKLATAYRYIPVALMSRDLPRETLLEALHAGLVDAWETCSDGLGERVARVLERVKSVSGQLKARLDHFGRELERDQRAGRFIQLGMLPPNPMAIGRYRLQHRVLPSLILSGDFVDYFRISDRYFAFYVADVAGHGASSAFVTVLLKNFSRRLRREYRPSMLRDPGEILQWLNRELLEQRMEKHVAIFLAVADLEEDCVRFANAGHYPPPVSVASGQARRLDARGKPIGLFRDVRHDVDSVHLDVGDRLVVFTDGVLEVLPDMGLAEKERCIRSAVAEHDSLDGLWRALGLSADESSHGPDDITCLTIARES